MITIWKFKIEINDRFSIEMPKGSAILCVQVQDEPKPWGQGILEENPCIWAVVDTEQPKEVRTFSVKGTGHPFHDFELSTLHYIGTFQLVSGSFIGHLFEVKKHD